jgi:hypothetical protein
LQLARIDAISVKALLGKCCLEKQMVIDSKDKLKEWIKGNQQAGEPLGTFL